MGPNPKFAKVVEPPAGEEPTKMVLVNFFAVLGVHPQTSNRGLRDAMLVQARQHHPDKGGDPEVMALINRAYEVLSDAKKRRQFLAEARQFPVCVPCKGLGYTKTRRGFASVNLHACTKCAGLGRVSD